MVKTVRMDGEFLRVSEQTIEILKTEFKSNSNYIIERLNSIKDENKSIADYISIMIAVAMQRSQQEAGGVGTAGVMVYRALELQASSEGVLIPIVSPVTQDTTIKRVCGNEKINLALQLISENPQLTDLIEEHQIALEASGASDNGLISLVGLGVYQMIKNSY